MLNICVNSKKRNTGIGRRLLTNFVEDHPKEDMELCVLKGNEAAVKLYQDCGFEVRKEYFGFSIDSVKPEALEMVRLCSNTVE